MDTRLLSIHTDHNSRAGLPRTGTTSLKAALEILGFGPTHHMIELFKGSVINQAVRIYTDPPCDRWKPCKRMESSIRKE